MNTIDLYGDISLTTEYGQFQMSVGFGTDSYSPILHSHLRYELFYVAKGSMEIICNDRKILLSDNSLVIIPPNILHYSYSKDPQLQRYMVAFQVQGANANDPLALLFDSMQVLVLRDSSDIQNAFIRLKRYCREDLSVRHSLMAACFHEILYLLKRELLNFSISDNLSKPSLCSENISEEYWNYVIDDYINQNFTGDISFKALKELVYMNERKLNRILHTNYGQSFTERVVYLRMQNAVKLLTETDMTVQSIAASVGYKSAYGFYLSFEKMYKMTPERYRKSHQNC